MNGSENFLEKVSRAVGFWLLAVALVILGMVVTIGGLTQADRLGPFPSPNGIPSWARSPCR